MNAQYPAIAERAAYRCEYGHAPEIVFNFPFEVEHVLPQARGGADTLDNLALACHACNLFKSDFETGPDEESQAEPVARYTAQAALAGRDVPWCCASDDNRSAEPAADL